MDARTMGEQNPHAELMRLVNGYQVSQAIHVAATLGIADLLGDAPRGSDDLAAEAGVHPGSLYRLLRALAAAGVFREEADRRFSLAPMGRASGRRPSGRSGPTRPSSGALTSGRPGATSCTASGPAGAPLASPHRVVRADFSWSMAAGGGAAPTEPGRGGGIGSAGVTTSGAGGR
jgi:hypothetical protein